MNQLLNEHTISVKGLNNALEVARVLIKNDYQVFIQLDDCDIYIIDYNYNNAAYGSERFASISLDEEDKLYEERRSCSNDEDEEVDEYDPDSRPF